MMKNQDTMSSHKKILVVGGGIGGIRAAMDLAESGRDVVLIDKSISIGGLMTQLDRTFPTNNCDLCTISPRLSEGGRQERIELMTMTEVKTVSGEKGNFTVTLSQAPRYIDLDRCTACGDCYKAFPECVTFSPGLDHRAPTCMRYPQAIPQAYAIDMQKCQDVEALENICKAGAILPQQELKMTELDVGAVILCPGAAIFDPSGLDHFEYEKNPDVVTSLEYERILSASGPTQGELVRPSDGKKPEKIAWIQCVGSRGIQKGAASYCSSACCMFALKEAMVTKERFQDSIETTIFYMDIRTFGKEYEQYRERAENEFHVNLLRSRPHSIVGDAATGNLNITYTTDNDGLSKTEAFDMAVLSTGFCIPDDIKDMALNMGIELNAHNFAKTDVFSPVSTSIPGIYACGLFESPKDIPETMVQASAAACLAARETHPAVNTEEDTTKNLPERDVSNEDPKVGIFICDCGLNIGGVVDTQSLADFGKTLPQVAVSQVVGHGCSKVAMDIIKQTIIDQKLNRVVIGGCSPRTHETKFQDLLKKAGLNKYLVEIANIRDQNTWVHADAPQAALQKAQHLIRMAVTSVKCSHPLTDHSLPMNKDILVVGGGITGMSSALSLADQGFKVFLVEKTAQLGGIAKNIQKTIEGQTVPPFIEALSKKIVQHSSIEVIFNAFIVDHTGMPGMFKTGLQIAPQMYYRQIDHGITILATGALQNRPNEYLLGEHPDVMTQLDMDGFLEKTPDRIKAMGTAAMIQCVGSRCPDNPDCSRVCCQSAVKNALRMLDINPDMRIFVLYRDMRTYGFLEDYYLEARKRGVIFVRYEKDNPPEVEAAEKGVTLSFVDPILGKRLSLSADCLCLSTGLVADDESTEDLAMIFRLQRTRQGFFLEDHVKLRPLDLSTPGFFVAGTAHSPKNIKESIADAQAVAGRAQALLAKNTIELGAAIARVDSNKCAACLICVRACPFDVPFINADGYSEIDPAKCHGCGVCAAECPAKAIQLMQFEDDQILAKLDGLLERMVA
ncbi:MAG: CoB--CoM heterodisulfide reductase iron-sulfur subunit A family protein [Deltaproteobacteria bacterium]|nr:CoB--CoM heterodisulfide reductase iron-sulfur subunit A family protein [Deltaproteobacteria bacterium]